MEEINELLTEVSGILWGWPMIALLLGTHILLTVRLRFPQRHIFKAIRLSVKKDGDAKGEVSQFGALSTALAATIGTGNIVGVGTAIALGGPGAVFWCWITGVLGIATKYGEGLLAVKYRINSNGRMLGGPMYAIEHGLASHKSGWMRRFWKLMAQLLHAPVPVTIEEKKALLLEHGIALWDVVSECDIHGSSD